MILVKAFSFTTYFFVVKQYLNGIHSQNPKNCYEVLDIYF